METNGKNVFAPKQSLAATGKTGNAGAIDQKSGIVLTPTEAEEYCRYKREKRIAEAAASLTKSEQEATNRDFSFAELKRICECAVRISSAAVRVNPVAVSHLKNLLSGKSTVLDCAVGGNGETTVKVKAYEAKRAVKEGAKEISLTLCTSALKGGRIGETKREIKAVCRAAKKAPVKVFCAESLAYGEILRLAKLASDCGARYLSVPFFTDCGRLKRDLHDVCMLEITGVENAADYKTLITAGVERIGTSRAEEIYADLMKEAENCSFTFHMDESVTVLPPSAPSAPSLPSAGNMQNSVRSRDASPENTEKSDGKTQGKSDAKSDEERLASVEKKELLKGPDRV